MNDDLTRDIATLRSLVGAKSKHSDYQLLHPSLAELIPEADYHPLGKCEMERQAYMIRHQPMTNLHVLDIGANTGYFSFAALESGARHVVSQEGNREHANFITLGARCLGVMRHIEVRPSYFDFSEVSLKGEYFDLVLCLNVLHHLGDDFGNPTLSLEGAKTDMINAINRLSFHANRCWMQLGFNWKGNRHRPLFTRGTKQEIIDFIQQGTKGYWHIDRIAVVDPAHRKYVDVNLQNLQRFESLGEFLNRPLFLLRSSRI